LMANVCGALTVQGYPSPARGNEGHLTLCRAKATFDSRRLAAVLDAHRTFRAPSFRVDSIVLYQSVLGSGPARYTPLATAPLGGAGPRDTGERS
jgi:2'-5' RNA ligase